MLVINGETIDDSVIQQQFERMLPRYQQQFPEQPEEEQKATLMQWAKETVTEQILFRQYAATADVDVPHEKVVTQYEQMTQKSGGEQAFLAMRGLKSPIPVQREVEIQLKAELLAKQIEKSAPEPTEEEIGDFYARHKDEFKLPERIHAAHIVKHAKNDAEKKDAYKEIRKVKKELDSGATFEQLAVQHSDCPDSAGDLGIFPRGQMVQEFEDVVFDSLSVGEISDTFWTPFGYHIAKKIEHLPEGTAPLDMVRESIRRTLQSQAREETVHHFLDSLRQKADIQEK